MSHKSHFDTLFLYYMPESGPCRTVMLAAKLLGIDLNMKHISLMKGEHLTAEYIKINPQHTVPTLVDNGFALSESRAIITYLCDKYGKKESLYPRDPKKRALINQRLFFDAISLYQPIVNCYRGVFYNGAKSFDETYMPKIEEAFKLLNIFLENDEYCAGNTLTMADIAIVSTIATAEHVLDFSVKNFENVHKWYLKMKATLPSYNEVIDENGKASRQMVYQAMGK